MMFLAVDLHYDLVHPYIASADFLYVAFACAGDPVYQYREKPIFPDFTWNFQSSRGT